MFQLAAAPGPVISSQRPLYGFIKTGEVELKTARFVKLVRVLTLRYAAVPRIAHLG